jgi:hypothetical protein
MVATQSQHQWGPRAPGQVRARELMRTPKFRPAGGAKPRPCRPHGLGTSKNLCGRRSDPYPRHGSRMSTRHHRRACAAPDPYGLSGFSFQDPELPACGSPRRPCHWHRCPVRPDRWSGVVRIRRRDRGGLRSSRAPHACSALASREYYDSMEAAFSASLAST